MSCAPHLFRSAVLVLLLGACSDPTTPDPAGITIEPGASARTLTIGSQQQLTARYVDAGGGYLGSAQAEWSVSDPRLASVDASGFLRLATSYNACDWVEPGLCRIEIVARSGDFEARQQLTILPFTPTIEVNAQLIDVEIGYPQQVRAQVLLELQPVPWCSVSYSTRNPIIATVDPGSGVINGMDIGTTVVDVNVSGPLCGGGAEIPVISREAFHVLTIEPDLFSALAAGESLQLTAIMTNWKDVTYAAPFVQWSSSHPTIATVEQGLVRAVGCPDDAVCPVTITATSGRLSASRVVNVR